MRNIKIISISPYPLWPNGENTGMPSFYMFHYFLAKKGYDVDFFQVNFIKGSKSYHCDGVNSHCYEGWRIHNKNYLFKVLGFFLSPLLWTLSTIYYLYPRLKKLKKQGTKFIIYGHTSYGAIAAHFIAKLLKGKNVTRIYGSLLPFELGLDENYPKSKLQILKNKILRWDQILAIRLKASHYIITNDGSLGDKLYYQYNKDENKISFLINGLAFDYKTWLNKYKQNTLSNPYENMFDNDFPVVINSGRLIDWKRFDRYLELANELLKRGVKLNFVILAMRGADSGETEKKLNRYIEKNNLSSNVKMIFNVPHKEIPVYQLFSHFAILTQDYLNLSNTLLELISLEKPVFALNVGGTSSIIEHGKNGYLLDLTNFIETSIPKIEVFLNNFEEQREAIRKGCKDWKAKNIYDWEHRITHDIEIIDRLSKDI